MLLCRCDCPYFEDESAIQSCYSQQNSAVKVTTAFRKTLQPSTATFWQSYRHLFSVDPGVKLSETLIFAKYYRILEVLFVMLYL